MRDSNRNVNRNDNSNRRVEVQREVKRALEAGPCHVREVAASVQLSRREAMVTLSRLKASGEVHAVSYEHVQWSNRPVAKYGLK